MGYGIKQTDSKFRIKSADKASALHALKELVTDKKLTWVDSATIKRCRNLADAMEECRWTIEEDVSDDFWTRDGDGDVVNISFSGGHAGDDLTLLKAIAPFVEAGSFIEMLGEGGEHWRWVFNGTTCTGKIAKVSWD